MSSFFWNSRPSDTEVMLKMLECQGAMINGLILELKNLSEMVQKFIGDEKSDFVPPKKLHEKNVIDVEDHEIFKMDMKEFFGECRIQSDTDEE